MTKRHIQALVAALVFFCLIELVTTASFHRAENQPVHEQKQETTQEQAEPTEQQKQQDELDALKRAEEARVAAMTPAERAQDVGSQAEIPAQVSCKMSIQNRVANVDFG
jgi:hypothetical protein